MNRSGAIGQGVLGDAEVADLLVDELARPAGPRPPRAWAMLIECSSVPVRKRVSSPSIRCQRAMTSAPMTSYSVCRPGLAVGVRDRRGQVVAGSVRHGTAMVAATAALTRRSRAGDASAEGVLQGLLGLIVQGRLADAPVIAAHRPDEQSDVPVLDEQEQRRAPGRQVVADLLDEAAVDARRHRPADQRRRPRRRRRARPAGR